jgi:hypothetical protein
MHHAVQTLESLHAQGDSNALKTAQATFAHYWMPENLPQLAIKGHEDLARGVEEWLPTDTYGGMRQNGLKTLEDYYSLLRSDDGLLLALEIEFEVPIQLNGVEHIITGTLDRLAIRKYMRKAYLSIEDFKTGKKPTYLRYGLQWTIYSWATTQPEFWAEFPETEKRIETYAPWARRGRWIDLHGKIAIHDCGWRGEQDYARMKVALAEYVRAVEADVYPLSISGANCMFCPFREVCGGVALPEENHGKP